MFGVEVLGFGDERGEGIRLVRERCHLFEDLRKNLRHNSPQEILTHTLNPKLVHLTPLAPLAPLAPHAPQFRVQR